ncbi:hypothetical protein A4H97_23145 [Niastella yeongjuensis]|uniref:Secretion system C-terminal sorting domain-containing protein n=1 Tax=Niastella yeongjuensis TaxID=354355 RepID=A0A1V9F4N4_9BACT|nr:T9SS type A sorting domain-containing protein [Niastella yeongjuensis]OQP53350.1 hypothetical protein A4H97_23145 [Niastella yeongjuensis]SEP14328.1 Por secretion system C-terminal sorting domain-containing protein [Niastella yeongjuensis]
MKVIQALNLLLIATCVYTSTAAQCTGGCPVGSLSMPVSSATLAAGSTYCITSSTDLSGNAYTVNGTLVIQSGTVTIGSITLDKAGVIRVKNTAKLIITGTVTGSNTTPVSAIDNLSVCGGGILDIIGSVSQGNINIAVYDMGAMKIKGAWTSGTTGTSVKIGKGSVIELCASFNFSKDGFFTETSTDPSYLVVHGGMMQSNFGGGWLSSKQGNSKIYMTTEAQIAFVSHPLDHTCSPCMDYHLAPIGTNSSCGSAAYALYNTVLSSPPDKPVMRPDDENTDKVAIYPNPVKKYLYLQLPKKHTYTSLAIFTQAGQLVHKATVKAGSTPTRYDLPAQLPTGIYFVQLTGNDSSLTLRVAKD